MKKGHYIGILCCLVIMACGVPSPKYEKTILQGNWLRVNSTDIRSDSMRITISSGDNAVITAIPATSNFTLQEVKWKNITPVTESGDFQFLDLSADGNFWKAYIIVESETELSVINADYPNAPGGEQSWVRF